MTWHNFSRSGKLCQVTQGGGDVFPAREAILDDFSSKKDLNLNLLLKYLSLDLIKYIDLK